MASWFRSNGKQRARSSSGSRQWPSPALRPHNMLGSQDIDANEERQGRSTARSTLGFFGISTSSKNSESLNSSVQELSSNHFGSDHGAAMTSSRQSSGFENQEEFFDTEEFFDVPEEQSADCGMERSPTRDSLPQATSIVSDPRALPSLPIIGQTTLPDTQGPPVPPKTVIPPPVPPKTMLRVPVGGYQDHQRHSGPSSSSTRTESALNEQQRANSDASVAYATFCEECHISARDIAYCNVCEMSFCLRCWDQQTVHKRRRLGPGGVPHEKTKPGVAKKVRNALAPPTDEKMRERLCKEDEVTSWFGIERPLDAGLPTFQDYGRFADLMATTYSAAHGLFSPRGAQLGRDTRTPSLVSFVGETGAGKSTLIKLIIDLASDETSSFATPVIGGTGAHVPTSEDVHLYLDPRTSDCHEPILFADCEGLGGGEREPVGALFKKKRRSERALEAQSGRLSKAVKIISERELAWADSPRARGREYAVTNLYPRLLYTFSDVIIFVLKNPRVVEHVFEKLVDWAAAAIETSSNQPVLPHAIIVLNASENDIDPKFWDVNANTSIILDDLAKTVDKNETFRKYAYFWRQRGKMIDTLEQLVLSYYSSIQILRVPANGRPNLIQEQVGKLYGGLLTACVAAKSNKRSLRMLLDVEDMQSYLEFAFSHFSGTLEYPFDFVQASFINSPIPPDFGGNILKLAINIMDVWKNQIDGPQIFQALSYMVASCIMLESTRHNIRGTVEQMFPKYLDHIDAALENFCDQHWPCEFSKPDATRCVNVRNGHGSKGHQSADGKVFAAGQYESQFTFATYQQEFRHNVFYRLSQLLGDLHHRLLSKGTETSQATTAKITAEIHRDAGMRPFYENVSGKGTVPDLFNSHTACLCCLFEPPEHLLPCGHVICTSCVRSYGENLDLNSIDVFECPLETGAEFCSMPSKVRIKPRAAGVRLLVLDGGGMRGIVELEILRAIENVMGGSLSISNFFDLVVGTSTGGLIALGIGEMKWSVEECIQKFEGMVRQAFTRRTGSTVPGVGWAVDNFNHSKYKTKPLEKCLKDAFTEDQYLFGGRKRAYGMQQGMRVAVTATSVSGRTPIVFGNYNRVCTEKIQYQFQRSERKTSELKTWETARATSAAPRFFRAFDHKQTEKCYVDGAIYHNNPINVAEQERKLIWPELQETWPDIILSLGTASSPGLRRTESDRTANQKGIVSHGQVLLGLLKTHMATSLECEKIHESFLAMLPRDVKQSRCRRVNPELSGDVPGLDEVKKMPALQETVRLILRNDMLVKEVALQLVATSFFYQYVDPITERLSGDFLSHGRIICRLPPGSREVSELGGFLKRRAAEFGQPMFVVLEPARSGTQADIIKIPHDTIERMVRMGDFTMPRTMKISIANRNATTDIRLRLADGPGATFPISGFPRSLFDDEKPTPMPHQGFMSNPNRWAGTSFRSKNRDAWVVPDPTRLRATASMPDFLTIKPSRGQGAELRREKSQNKPTETTREPQENFFRSAFRALARPVRPRPKAEDLRTAYEMGGDNITGVELENTERGSVPAELDSNQTYEIDGRDNDLYQSYLGTLQSTTLVAGSAPPTTDSPPNTSPPRTGSSPQSLSVRPVAPQVVFEMEGEGHHMMPFSPSLG